MQNLIKQQAKKSSLIWDYFYQISGIPHGSFNLRAISEFIKGEADRLGLPYQEDAIGNICVRIPATAGFQSVDSVIFQAHTDMVCEKNAGTLHNFERDPIQWQVKGDRLYARETTLGADNGIGVATLLSLMADESFAHPMLECLFTVDEEVGLIGAQKIDPSILEGKFLINLDNEDEGVFCIGCAGGFNSLITKKDTQWESKSQGFLTTIQIKGLSGGHSGMEIHKGLGNANVLIMAALSKLQEMSHTFQIVSIQGGDKSNAIPRECTAFLWSESGMDLSSLIESLRLDFAATLKEGQDQNFSLEEKTEVLAGPVQVLRLVDTQNLVRALAQVPHGIRKMFNAHLVGTSVNFASIRLAAGEEVHLVLSHRSLWREELDPAVHYSELQATFKELGFVWELNEGYFPWEPKEHSPISDYAAKIYQETFDKTPVREVIHAGLECGVIGSKKTDLDMISFGPTIRGAHTPEEYVDIPSVERYWIFIKALLSNCKTL